MTSAAWLALSVSILELCARNVARGSILAWTGTRPSAWTLVAVAAAAAVVLLAGRPAAPAGAPTVRRGAWRTVLPLFAALFAAGLAAQLHFGARLQSDGFYYFAYLRSIAFDRDVEFSNDYRLLGLDDKPYLFEPTPTGYAQSAWTIGPAIAWAPFFGAGHVVASQLARSDPNVSTNGISFPYRQAVAVAGLFYALVGCWFCYRVTARFFPDGIAAAATAAVMLGSFMVWYIVKEPSMTHAPSMAAVAGFVWAWLATRRGPWGASRPVQAWVWLGAIAGFMTLIRWQNALFAVLPASDALVLVVSALRTGDRPVLRRTLACGVLFTLAATATFAPQMIAWRSIYGSWLAVSPVGPQIRWSAPQILDVLWSSRNGLFSWSPVLYLGAVGLLLFTVRHRTVGVPMLAGIALMTYFNASIQDWWGSDGFGGRRFDGTIPLFCIGVAAFLAWAIEATRRHPHRVVGAAGALLVAWNLALMSATHEGAVQIGRPVSFGDTAAAQSRTLHRWFGNPFTYPASLAFALRHGLTPAQYDLLRVNRFMSDPLQPYGRLDLGGDDEWAVGEGWHAAEVEPPQTSFRWATGHARLLVPLDHAAPLALQIRLQAFGYPGAPPQTVTARINGHEYGPHEVPGRWGTIELATERDAWRAGVNRLDLRFAWAAAPADVGLGGDPRRLAAAVDFVRVQALATRE